MRYHSQEAGNTFYKHDVCSYIKNYSLVLLVASSLASCAASREKPEISSATKTVEKGKVRLNLDARLAKAQSYFNAGQYGSAEQAFRLAIETDPYDIEAWLGIAATYDNLKKFPNANKAYMIAVKLKGYTPEILNNLGYHYILRGHFDKARKALIAAQRKQPDNPYIQNNLRLLGEREAAKNRKTSFNDSSSLSKNPQTRSQ